MSREAEITGQLAEVRERVARAALETGRDAGAVTLVVVTKTVPLTDIGSAIAAGAFDLGENRVQELVEKAEQIDAPLDAPRWHLIGRLQRNKVRAAAPYVTLWQSVDREDLAVEIARRAPGAAVLVQVNVTGEVQKGGCALEATAALVDACRTHGLRVEGLMTVPPAEGDPRAVFGRLRRLTDELALDVCSMGMSGDFEATIAEGSTMVRVGSAIFGPRPGPADARR